MGVGVLKRRKPRTQCVAACVILKQGKPPRPCNRCLNTPDAKEAWAPTQLGTQWSQSEGGNHAPAEETSVVAKRSRPLVHATWG